MMQPLYLVGPRGCGKTTIGMALAQATGFRFADLAAIARADERR